MKKFVFLCALVALGQMMTQVAEAGNYYRFTVRQIGSANKGFQLSELALFDADKTTRG